MDFFNFGKPRWFKDLPAYFQPDESRVQEIESFRASFGIDDNSFVMMISMSPWSVKKLQRFMLKKFRAEQPTCPEEEIWKAVIISRMNVKLMTVDYPPDFGSSPLSRNVINEIIEHAGEIVQSFKSFDDVIRHRR